MVSMDAAWKLEHILSGKEGQHFRGVVMGNQRDKGRVFFNQFIEKFPNLFYLKKPGQVYLKKPGEVKVKKVRPKDHIVEVLPNDAWAREWQVADQLVEVSTTNIFRNQ